jgi:hypothetical protein
MRWSNCDIASEQPDIATADVAVSYVRGERAGRPSRLASPSPVSVVRMTGLDRRFLAPRRWPPDF